MDHRSWFRPFCKMLMICCYVTLAMRQALWILSATVGHKVVKHKMQLCKSKVEYLGFVLASGTRQLSPKRIEVIQRIPTPTTRKELLTFLGMINYCHQWIPECSHYDSILREAVRSDSPENVCWSPDMLAAYIALTVVIVQAQALGLLVYCKPFHLYVWDKCKTMAAVCAQEQGGGMRPIAFFSKVVQVPVQGMPACLRALIACAMAVETATTITLGHPTILHASHQVTQLITNLTTQHMTAQHLSGYEILFLNTHNLSFGLNKV
ncbi:Hypothetical predicted protein [Pelobates cultripes]|uniref:Reverse transcriptase RNase H-like domain-containing protein n=2 Tax=Pelobates cultripes TaxID=61616 RepID=A0AAD1W9Z4_PELCU|nr:Hypothetical predicted protein [Pelobates cultripes]